MIKICKISYKDLKSLTFKTIEYTIKIIKKKIFINL